MNKDLEWLARNVSEWPTDINGFFPELYEVIVCYVRDRGGKEAVACQPGSHSAMQNTTFGHSEWHQARQELGLICTPEEDEAWEARMDAIGQNGNDGDHYDAAGVVFGGKQPRYQDAKGEDWIDEAARTFTAEEFRGAMRFSIGKYNRRMGKKDELVKEIEKMRDYCERWLEVEKRR
jgi:hypothetical protein